MKLNTKIIATIAAFATVFAVTTMQDTAAQAGPFGTGNWSGFTGMSSGSGR